MLLVSQDQTKSYGHYGLKIFFSISAFEILLHMKYLFVLLRFIAQYD